MPSDDPFLQFAGATVVETGPAHAVAEQRHDPELDNHAGVRHAGALFTVGYAASRALVATALSGREKQAPIRLADCQIAFEKMVSSGAVTARAEAAVEDWQSTLDAVSSGEEVLLSTIVTLRDDGGTIVATMSVSWNAGSKS